MTLVPWNTPEEEVWFDEREVLIAWPVRSAMLCRLADLADVRYKQRSNRGSTYEVRWTYRFHPDDVRRVQMDIIGGRTVVPDLWRTDRPAGQNARRTENLARTLGILAPFVLVAVLWLLATRSH